MVVRREKELHCLLCARSPLLATYGVDSKGKLFVHVKIWKQNRIFGELMIEGGVVRLKCRECLRWQVITIQQRSVTLCETVEVLPLAIN